MSTPKPVFGKYSYPLLLFYLVALTLIISCKKLDQLTVEETKQFVKSESRFFTDHAPKDTLVKSVLGFVKRENEKHQFVDNLIKKIGYPYWDKAIIARRGNGFSGRATSDSTNTVFIPFVMDSAKTVNHTLIVKTSPSDTNFLLIADWQYVKQTYGSPSVDSTAENVALLFMMEDKNVFGYDRFTITDSNLFSTIPTSPNYNGREIRFPTSAARTMLEYEVEVCFNTYVCNYPNSTNCSDGCDYMNCATNINPCHLVLSVCWYYTYDVGGGGWSTGSGGGPEGGVYGGGGSGGGWNSWDPPICEEEPQGRSANYQDCGPGWIPPGIDVPIEYDPCAEAQLGASKATTLSQNSVYSTAKSNIQSAGASDNNEHSVTFGKDAGNNITASSMTTGGPNSGNVTTSWPGAFADIHNHPANTTPSPGDFYGLITTNQNYSGYDTRFVVTASGSVYALLITDLARASAWATNNPMQQITGFPPDFPVTIADDFADAKSYMINIMGINSLIADEMAMALVLEKYNTGVALLKQNPGGDFKRLLTSETTVNGATTYTANNCQ